MVMNPALRDMFRKVLPASLLVALVCSCGIFSPRPSQTPNGNSTADPLSFSTLEGTQYTFSSLQFEDLFQGDDPIYFDDNSGPSTKATLIQRLNYITQGKNYPYLKVEWTGLTWTPLSPDSVTVNVAKYYVFLNNSGAQGSTADDSGNSIFTLVQNSGWHINSWKDFPAGQGASFFSPNYSH